jgi:5-methylcytosine-specific restriction endonuclease McrA
MPKAPDKICRICGANSADKSLCEKHSPLVQKGTHPYYNSKKWRGEKGLRKRKLSEIPYCENCYAKKNIAVPATVVDHIIPWRKAKDTNTQIRLFTDYDNLQSLCDTCHNSKTGRGQ